MTQGGRAWHRCDGCSFSSSCSVSRSSPGVRSLPRRPRRCPRRRSRTCRCACPVTPSRCCRAPPRSPERQAAITPDPPITLTVVLNRSDEAGFQRFLADIEDPHSANHGKFLSQDEITKRFGPSQQAYDETVAYLQQQGLTLVEGSANRLTLTVKGTRTQVEHAFSVQIGDYQLGNRSFYANDQDPLVPGSMAQHIQAVAGLSNLAQPQPAKYIGQWSIPGSALQRPYGTAYSQDLFAVSIVVLRRGSFTYLDAVACALASSRLVLFSTSPGQCSSPSTPPRIGAQPFRRFSTAAGASRHGAEYWSPGVRHLQRRDVSAYLNF